MKSGRSRSSRGGRFSARPAVATPALEVTEAELPRLLAVASTWRSCAWRYAARKNILVSGATGSGKTTWTKALIREIPPTSAW